MKFSTPGGPHERSLLNSAETNTVTCSLLKIEVNSELIGFREVYLPAVTDDLECAEVGRKRVSQSCASPSLRRQPDRRSERLSP
jgi:hypothetical protein